MGLGSTMVGYLKFLLVRGRKGLDIDLWSPRLVRCISNPARIGRELSHAFIEFRSDIQKWFAAAIQRENPEIVFGLRILISVKQEQPIAEPVLRTLGSARFQRYS